MAISVHLWLCWFQAAGGFIADDAETVAAFTAQTMNQSPRFFMSQAAGFTAALADHRPTFTFEFARHQNLAALCGVRVPTVVGLSWQKHPTEVGTLTPSA